MISKAVLLSFLIAYAEARFGQEQVPIQAISQVQGGDAGAAATIAGAAISDLLGAAGPCAKLTRADQIVSELGGGADAIAAAIGMVTAEKNTNPFANGNAQVLCSDATLPATAELRGITPLIDPDVDVDGVVNALSAQTAANPLNADGMSVFDLVNQNGGQGLVQSSAGGAAAGGNNANQGAAGDNNQNQNQNGNNGDNQNQNQNGNNGNNGNNANQDCEDDQGQQAGNQQQQAGNGAAAGGNAVGDADFGKCTPTIIFEGGQNGRPADEFTFQIADELARGGQQEALNPDIITNALCNQLTNVCEANDAAITLCEQAKAQVQGGPRDKSTADAFNAAVGFPGAVTNPSGGPADVTAKRSLRRRAQRFSA